MPNSSRSKTPRPNSRARSRRRKARQRRAKAEEVEIDESLDDAAFIEEEEEGDPDVTDIIGETIEKEEET